MQAPTTHQAPHPAPAGDGGVLVRLRPGVTDEDAPAERSLRCVSSGYMAGGCSCPSAIPARVVAAAWARQQARGEVGEEGMFRFAWQGEIWLAFGQAGRVRGVYCPTHVAERDARLGGGGMQGAAVTVTAGGALRPPLELVR